MNQIPATDIDLWADDVLVDPYPAYEALRALGPVVHDPERDVYILTRYDDIRAAVQDWETFSSAHGVGVSPTGNRRAGNGILTTDPPRHEQLRKVMTPHLVANSLAEHQDYLDEVAETVVRDVVGRGTFDAVVDLGQRYSIEVVSHLTGLPVEGRENYMRWAGDGFNITGPDNDLCTGSWDGFFEMVDYSFNFLTPERLAPGRWGCAFRQAGDDGDIEPDAAAGLVMAIVWAGIDTTVNAIASAIYLFGTNHDQWDRLRADRSLMSGAVAEVLRMEPPVQRFTRFTTRSVEVGGFTIPAEARVVVLFGSANRDERQFPEPERFDIGRNPTNHLSFGRGIHRCVGASLAKVEITAVLDQLADSVERFDIAETEWRRNNGLHGPDRLTVSVATAQR